MAYPATFDALTNPTAGSLLTSPSHATQHINANDIIEAIELHVGLRGVAFPGSPATDTRFLRTDRNLEYFWNGTRWLTTTLYDVPLVINATLQPFAATTTPHRNMVPHAGVYDLWLENFQASFYVTGGTALGASHKWVVTLQKEPAAAVVATINIASGATDTWRTSGQVAIGALVGVTNFAINAIATKTGTPGTLFLMATLTYRMVG